MADTSKNSASQKSKPAANKQKQVFDVSHPGSSPPSATSRPVIVGSGSVMQDPMVNKKTTDIAENESSSTKVNVKTPSGSSRIVQPLAKDNTTEKDASSETVPDEASAKDTGTKSSPASDAESAIAASLPAAKSKGADKSSVAPASNASDGEDNSVNKADNTEKPSDDTEATTQPSETETLKQPDSHSNDNAVVEAVLNQSGGEKTAEAKNNPPDEARLQKLIDDKTYFVTVGRHSRQRRVTLVLLFFVLLAATALALLAAHEYGYITI